MVHRFEDESNFTEFTDSRVTNFTLLYTVVGFKHIILLHETNDHLTSEIIINDNQIIQYLLEDDDDDDELLIFFITRK